MKYTVRKNIHNDFGIFEINKLSPRAYGIPYNSAKLLKETTLRAERYSSDMVTCLSGEWGFKFYKSISKLPDTLATGKVKFDTVTVPSDWQRTGHEAPVYLNCPYQFKTFEPDIPEDMPVGVYTRKFCVEKTASKYIISFLGVANNLSLYVNGEFVGYSEGTHNTAEFDVTDILKDGENEIVCVLFKWCNGSFLEAQDMFRDNGIFRDVLLYAYSEKYIYDYEAVTDYTADGYTLKVNYTTGEDSELTVKAVLATTGGRTIAKAEGKDGTADFGIVNVKEWSAEIPEIYYLYITVYDGKKEVMTLRNVTGFKHIEIEGIVFKFNNQPVKLIGANHHDTDMRKGYAMNLDDMERDIRLMKEYNCNAVRTSHYPPDPFFLTMADVYGLYVVDEADIETHGCGEMAGDQGYLTTQKRWISHFVDRVRRMYYRDRSHPSITMWSLGNESGSDICHEKCNDFLKSTGTKLPVHNEGACGRKRMHFDVMSEMYTTIYSMDEMIAGKREYYVKGKKQPKLAKDYNKVPFFLCEYAHAMGVGPGGMQEYVDRFFAYEGFMGGCVWEWADHVVYHEETEKNYKYRYTYGGDHGEKQHDGNFCVDALMYADRTPHTGAKQMKVLYRPLRMTGCEDHAFTFTNVNRFRKTDYIETKWEFYEEGRLVKSGKLDLNLAPMASKTVKLDLCEESLYCDYYVNFIYTDKTDGHEIATEQAVLTKGRFVMPGTNESDFEISKSKNGLTVSFEGGSVRFAGDNVTPVSLIYNRKEHLSANPEKDFFNVNIGRAFIDNDSGAMRPKWIKAGVNTIKTVLDNSLVNICPDCVEVLNSYKLMNSRKAAYYLTVAYRVYGNGRLNCAWNIEALSDDVLTDLPRFGCTFELAGDFEDVKYYGRGPAENMPDFCAQSPIGIYSDKITDMYEPYVFPQESGMHCETKWVELRSEDGKAVMIKGMPEFAFCVHHFTQDDIQQARHQEDVHVKDTTYVNVDGYVRGIGSNSCGSDTWHWYVDKELDNHGFAFDIIPVK